MKTSRILSALASTALLVTASESMATSTLCVGTGTITSSPVPSMVGLTYNVGWDCDCTVDCVLWYQNPVTGNVNSLPAEFDGNTATIQTNAGDIIVTLTQS